MTHHEDRTPAHEPEDDQNPAQDSVDQRAELLPEEEAVGSEDPQGQARAILEESAERTDDPEGTREDYQQTPDQQIPHEPV